MNKKGVVPSETSHVAIVVIVIALLMVAYFVLIPDEEKEKLLDIEIGEEAEGEINLILAETPGHVYPYTWELEEKKIPAVSLFSQIKTSSQDLATKIHVSRNIFTGQTRTLDFVLDDINRVKSLGLFFNIVKSKGGLRVDLNGEEVFRGEVVTGDLPVDLPVGFLERPNNELKIHATNPGWRFLSTNYYDVKDVKLIKRYSVENKFESRDFVIYDREKVKKIDLEFYANCMDVESEQGFLELDLNDVNLFSGRISCVADKIRLDIDRASLRNGQNVLSFSIDKGNYVLEHMLLNLDLEREYYPEYYFVIDDLEGEYELNMDFSESGLKRATVMINGREVAIATDKMDYSKDVTGYMVEGENYLKIVAKEEFTITNLEIVQEK